MANVLALLKPTAQPSMNGFDLSQKHVYSSSSGRIDSPVQIETVPRDKFQIDLAALMRTMTLQTAAFLRGKVTYDFYFVPYSQIWHPFNQFIGQRKDVHSANQKGIKFVPCIHLMDLFELCWYVYQYQKTAVVPDVRLNDVQGYCWSTNLFRMLDFFGYGNYLHLQTLLLDEDTTHDDWAVAIEPYHNKYVNVFRPAAYQHIWYDYYRNKFYDNYEFQENAYMSDYVLSFNFDDIKCGSFSESIIPIKVDIDNGDTVFDNENLRVIMLFTQRYVQYKQDLFQSALPSTQFGVVSSVELDLSDVSLAISSSLSGNPAGSLEDVVVGSPTYDDNAQSLVYAPLGATYESSPNAVSFKTNVNGEVTDMDNLPLNFRTPHSHPLGGQLSLNKGNMAVSSGGVIDDRSSLSFDVLTLKRAEALQKWRQNALRAGNMVDDSFRAHYGATPRYESDNNALKLGSFEGKLDVNAVTATAASDAAVNGQVGDLGATGVTTIQGKKIHFECSDFGVIVCFNYFRPESEYNSTMIDKANRLSEPFDFFTPEFQNMGLDTINMVDYNNNMLHQNTVLGYAAQYWWYKQALDKVHGEFAKYYFKYTDEGSIQKITGNTNMWVAPRDFTFYVTGSGFKRGLKTLYVAPEVLDNIFGVNYSENVFGLDGFVDQFHFNCYFDIKAIRPMSVVGLPNF